MREIFSSHDAAKYCGEELLSSPSPHNRVLAARVLGRYRGYEVINALLPGLQDSTSQVRNEIFLALGRHHYDRLEDLMPIARAIQEALELEDVGTPAWYSGKQALEKLSQQAEPLVMEYKRWDCWDRVRSKFEQ